jgi:hypothetical protein
MENLKTLLGSLGLENQEAEVYLAALRLGTAPASTIAKRVDIPRSTARYTCEQLVAKQLMAESQKGNTKLFTIESPEKLQKLLDLQQGKIKDRQLRLDMAIQDLKRIYNPYTVMPKIRFFEGVNGLIEMFEDVLSDALPMFGASCIIGQDTHPDLQRYKIERYHPMRKKIRHATWMIFNDNPLAIEYQKVDSEFNRTSLLVPSDLFPFKVTFHIYGNKVAFYSQHISDMTGVVIENTHIRDTQMSLYRLAWDEARRLEINKKNKDAELPS